MVDPVPYLRLGAPVGAGRENTPDDVEALDWAMRRIDSYAPPPEYRSGPQRYATTPMIDAVRRLQAENALLVDGTALPGGPTERLINNALLEKPRGASLLVAPIAPLGGTVGDGFANSRSDVLGVQRALGALNYGPEDPFDRPHGFIDARTIDGVKRFQRDKGLAPDGWMAPGGETERAMRQSLENLAQVKGREWLAYAERAERAQEDVKSPPSGERTGNDKAALAPIAWFGSPPDSAGGREVQHLPGEPDEGRVEPAQTAPGDYIVPFLFLTLPALLGLGEANRRRLEAEKRSLDADEIDSGKTELIPPFVPNEPMRGPDPAKPPLNPHETRIPPSTVQPPPAPNREELKPTRIDPRNFILITPDQSDEFAQYIFAERRRGGPETRTALQIITQAVRNLTRKWSRIKLAHRGGSRDEYGAEVPEKYYRNYDTEGREGSSYGDITFETTNAIVHFSLYRPHADGTPIQIEIDQAERLAYNTNKPCIVIMIENRYGRSEIDQKALERYMNSVLTEVEAGKIPKGEKVYDPKKRDQIIRRFDPYKRN